MPANLYSLLGDITPKEFVAEFWQQKPLLIRNAVDTSEGFLAPDELAGLSMEEGVESRYITENPSKQGAAAWKLKHGPFDAKHYNSTPEKNWTLLVQAVDHFDTDAAALLDKFNFIPNWRVDDVMVSYAAPGGSVGPHFDNYDVFLLQSSGQRRWKIGPKSYSSCKTIEHTELRILEEMQTDHEWLLNPGDMLYIPPNYSHHGVSESEGCMTYSIGFRAPKHSDLLSHFTDHIIDNTPADQFFSDPNFPTQDSGCLTQATQDRIYNEVLSSLKDKDSFTQWLAQALSQSKYQPDNTAIDIDDCFSCRDITDGSTLYREPSATFLYTGENDQPEKLFINEDQFDISKDQQSLVKLLASQSSINTATLMPLLNAEANVELLNLLFQHQFIYLNEDE